MTPDIGDLVTPRRGEQNERCFFLLAAWAFGFNFCGMEIPIHALLLRSIVPTDNGAAIFVSDAQSQKTFLIHTSAEAARTLATTLEGKETPRPLTHEFIRRVFTGFDVTVDHVLLTRVEAGVFYATVRLVMKNELGSKIVDIDARPSDAFILAVQNGRPIFATQSVLDNVEDMSELLVEITKAALSKAE
jgi:bifunctional DNase/RNase